MGWKERNKTQGWEEQPRSQCCLRQEVRLAARGSDAAQEVMPGKTSGEVMRRKASAEVMPPSVGRNALKSISGPKPRFAGKEPLFAERC
ncbi:hypothetical protein RJ60_12315 [Mesotoga sp. B105.6.4]|nr:hypothetical protein RJ60_12315 [Mesotoga sp. B105.6.4]